MITCGCTWILLPDSILERSFDDSKDWEYQDPRAKDEGTIHKFTSLWWFVRQIWIFSNVSLYIPFSICIRGILYSIWDHLWDFKRWMPFQMQLQRLPSLTVPRKPTGMSHQTGLLTIGDVPSEDDTIDDMRKLSRDTGHLLGVGMQNIFCLLVHVCYTFYLCYKNHNLFYLNWCFI